MFCFLKAWLPQTIDRNLYFLYLWVFLIRNNIEAIKCNETANECVSSSNDFMKTSLSITLNDPNHISGFRKIEQKYEKGLPSINRNLSDIGDGWLSKVMQQSTHQRRFNTVKVNIIKRDYQNVKRCISNYDLANFGMLTNTNFESNYMPTNIDELKANILRNLQDENQNKWGETTFSNKFIVKELVESKK